MTTTTPTRRSPRSITRFCLGVDSDVMIPADLTATILALAHCSGWSADYINLTVQEFCGLSMGAEHVWELHARWMQRRSQIGLTEDEFSTALFLLHELGLPFTGYEVPLSLTARPVSVRFRPSWAPNVDRVLFPSYDNIVRMQVKAELALSDDTITYGNLTSVEAPVVLTFGWVMANIITNVLSRWSVAMNKRLLQTPGIRPIHEKEQVKLIMRYLNYYQVQYETYFGTMEPRPRSPPPGSIRNRVIICSTGYGTKVFLGLMMADRIFVIDQKRKAARERIGFVYVDPEHLAEDEQNCSICREPLRGECLDGTPDEIPVKLLICCSQIFGLNCLRRWLSNMYRGELNESCPACRFVFPHSFIQKIFTPEQSLARMKTFGAYHAALEMDFSELAAPSPEPEELDDIGELELVTEEL